MAARCDDEEEDEGEEARAWMRASAASVNPRRRRALCVLSVCMYVCERERKKERETSGNPLVREHGIVSRVHEPCRG